MPLQNNSKDYRSSCLRYYFFVNYCTYKQTNSKQMFIGLKLQFKTVVDDFGNCFIINREVL